MANAKRRKRRQTGARSRKGTGTGQGRGVSRPRKPLKRQPKRVPKSKPAPRGPKRPKLIPRPRARPQPRPPPRPKPAPIVKTPYPATWFLRDYKTGASRRGQLAYLRKTIHQLRSVYTGFTSKDGFDARHPQNWTAHQHDQVIEFGSRLHSLISTQHMIVKPRTKAEARALRMHTQQLHPRQKFFVIHTTKPLRAEVFYTPQPERLMPFFAPPIGGGLRVEIVERYQDGKLELVDRDYLFYEMLGYQPLKWDEFVLALRMLLPFLPDKTDTDKEAYYTLLSKEHGPISSPAPKSMLMEKLLEWAEEYSNEFAATLIGVRYQGDRYAAAMSETSEYNQRQRRRQLFRRMREQDRKDAQRLRQPKPRPRRKHK